MVVPWLDLAVMGSPASCLPRAAGILAEGQTGRESALCAGLSLGANIWILCCTVPLGPCLLAPVANNCCYVHLRRPGAQSGMPVWQDGIPRWPQMVVIIARMQGEAAHGASCCERRRAGTPAAPAGQLLQECHGGRGPAAGICFRDDKGCKHPAGVK